MRRAWGSVPRRPDPEVVRTDDRGTVLVGTGVWALALVACAVWRDQLVAAGNGWWLGVCAAGVGLGFVALAHLHRLEVRHRRRTSGRG